MLGCAFRDLDTNIDNWRQVTRERVKAICEARQRDNMPSDSVVAVKADKEIIGVCWLAWFTVVKSVAEAVGARLLSRTYSKVVSEDPAIPNKFFALTISMDHDQDFPIRDAEQLYRDVMKNWFAQSLLRSLVAHHFYLYREPMPLQQKVCDRLQIGLTKRVLIDERKSKNREKGPPHQQRRGKHGRFR